MSAFPAHTSCVELDASLIEDAGEYLADRADRVTFVNASVTDTGLESDAYDAAYARFLFQHLPDPAAAANETFRILRPGAPFVISDIDDAIEILTDPEIPLFDAIKERFVQAQATRGGDRRIGRRLPRILKGAGFDKVEVRVTGSNSQADGLEPFIQQLDPRRLSPLVADGLVRQDELDELVRQRDGFVASDPFIMFLGLMVVGRKPGA